MERDGGDGVAVSVRACATAAQERDRGEGEEAQGGGFGDGADVNGKAVRIWAGAPGPNIGALREAHGGEGSAVPVIGSRPEVAAGVVIQWYDEKFSRAENADDRSYPAGDRAE